MEAEKAAKKLADEGAKKPTPPSGNKHRRRRIDSDDEDDDNDDDNDSDEGKGSSRKATTELDAVKEIQCKAEQRKAYLMQLMSTRIRPMANFKYVIYHNIHAMGFCS